MNYHRKYPTPEMILFFLYDIIHETYISYQLYFMKNRATEYLANYSQKANYYITSYLDNKIKEASSIGLIPQKTLTSFKEMCLGGKKIRGALMVLGYEICGGKDLTEILKTSIFLEIFHTGILVHDDVMDKAEKRRGRISLNKEYGDEIAICIGDFAFFQAYELLSSAKFHPELKEKAIRLFSQYNQRLAFGQEMDVKNSYLENTKEENIIKIIKYKTAEYTGVLPLLLGAIFAGEKDPKKILILQKLGLSIGWLFQIRDDILGTFGEEENTGKSSTSDLEEGKITLLQFYLYKHGTSAQKNLQDGILGKKDTSRKNLKEMRRVLKESGALEYSLKMMEKYNNEAINIIPQITSDKKLQQILIDLILFLKIRNK